MELYSSTANPVAFYISVHENSAVLNDYQLSLFEIVNFLCLSTIITIFGIAGNIINIVIFLTQGFTNSVNISFFGLAISDLCCLITLLWIIVWLNPFIGNSGVPVHCVDFQYLTGSWPHGICGRITSYITTFVTVERCLCILFPLKIKQLVTPTRTATAVCSIFAINVLVVIPEYVTSYLDWKFFPDKNKTLLAIFHRNGRDTPLVVVTLLFFFVGILSFLALIGFTVTLAIKLQQSSEWRKEATSGSDQHISVTNRQKKTVKMIVVIATVLIVCYTPGMAISLGAFVVPEFHFQMRYFRLCLSLWSIACVFNAVNSSINILLYYNMSSKYRQTFNIVFRRSGKMNDICHR